MSVNVFLDIQYVEKPNGLPIPISLALVAEDGTFLQYTTHEFDVQDPDVAMSYIIDNLNPDIEWHSSLDISYGIENWLYQLEDDVKIWTMHSAIPYFILDYHYEITDYYVYDVIQLANFYGELQGSTDIRELLDKTISDENTSLTNARNIRDYYFSLMDKYVPEA